MDGVGGADAMPACADEVGAHPAVIAEGGVVCQYPETAWWRFGPLTACSDALLRPGDGEVGREQPDLPGLVLQPVGADNLQQRPVISRRAWGRRAAG